MPRVELVHWKAEEVASRAERLRAAGYEVTSDALASSPPFKALRESPPDAVVIDLGRLPAQGRDVGLLVREAKTTRHVPLVFVGGRPEKIDRVRQSLPDAVYTTWERIGEDLAHAIAHPPADPVVPRTRLDGYSGTPLPKKLGIKAGAVVLLVGAPESFEATLGELPAGATLRRRTPGRAPAARADLAIWFVTARRELERRIEAMGQLAGGDGLWIAWPKQASGVATDVTQNLVRQLGLASGLVDYKIAAIDATWSGLKFARRDR